MQKAIIAVLTAAVVILTAALLRSQRLNHDLSARAEAQDAALAVATERQQQAAAESAAHSAEADALKARLAALDKPVQTAVPEAAATVAPGTQGTGAKGPDFVGRLAEMMQSPDMQEAIRAQQKLMLPMLYGALFKRLGLDAEALDRLKEMLLDRQMAAVAMMGKGDKPAQMAAFAEARKASDAALKELLGGEQFAVFQDYEATVGERLALGQLNQQLADKDIPLDDVQQEELVTLMVEERARLKIPSTPEQQAAWAGGMPSTEALAGLLQQMEEMNRRVYARSGEILSEAQQAELQSYQNNQMQAQRLGLQMMKGLAGGEKGD